MRTLIVSMILAMSLAPDRPAPKVPQEAAKNMDFEKLQGAWAVIEYETENGKLNADALKNHAKLNIKGNMYSWGSSGGGTFKIDPTKSPKTVDYYPSIGGDPKQIWQGIYEVDGDTFRDCIAPPGKPRPRDFSTPPGSGHLMQAHRRVP